MSEAPDIETEQERELRRRFGAGNDKQNLDDSSASKHDNLSPADSDNEQRLGSDTADSDHVRKKIIDFFDYYWKFNSKSNYEKAMSETMLEKSIRELNDNQGKPRSEAKTFAIYCLI